MCPRILNTFQDNLDLPTLTYIWTFSGERSSLQFIQIYILMQGKHQVLPIQHVEDIRILFTLAVFAPCFRFRMGLVQRNKHQLIILLYGQNVNGASVLFTPSISPINWTACLIRDSLLQYF